MRLKLKQLQALLDESLDNEHQESVNAEYWFKAFQDLKAEILEAKDLRKLQARCRLR